MRIAQALRTAVATTTALTGTLLLGAQIAHADDPAAPTRTGVTVITGTTGSAVTPAPTATTGNNPWD